MINILKTLLILEVISDNDPILIKRKIQKKTKKWGWWIKEGHWNHTSFLRAMSHLFSGGEVRFGRW